MLAASRTYDAADHVSGAAEPAGPPFSKPIDARVGSVPKGEAGRSGSSQFCSGMSPTPEPKSLMSSSSDAAPLELPVARVCSPRSAESAGQR